MDPLSVTASIITLITATGSVLQHLESVKSRMNPYAELLAIMNTVRFVRSLQLLNVTAIGD